MNRWLVSVLVLLAVIVLVAPALVGRLAEKSLEENIDWAESESAGIEFQTESFDRGWFTSEGRHRVVLSGTSFREAAEAYRRETGNADLPSLVVDTRVDHGPVPLASLGRESGTLEPGLASMVSTFQLDPGDGELEPLPGTLYSNVALSGATDARYLLEAGDFEHEGNHIAWQGADITVNTDPSTGAIIVDGRVEPFTISENNDTLRMGAMSIAANQVDSDYGLNIGSAEFSIESMEVESMTAPVTIGKVSISGDASIDDTRLNVGSKVSVDQIVVPGMGDVHFAMEMSLNRLDAAATAIVARAFQEAQGSADPEAALAVLFTQIESDLQKIIAAGAEFRIDQLDVTLPQGKVETRMSVDIPEGDADDDFSWSSVLLKMKANADVRMPAELFEFISLMNPQASSLVAMGILISDGDDLVMKAEYAQGLLNVNGAPMPIPMPEM